MRKLLALLFSIDAGFVPPVTTQLPLDDVAEQDDPVCKLRYELFDYDPNPTSGSLVVASDKQFRAQVLTEDLFRFEYSETGEFENRPTLTFLNRNLSDIPKFTHFEQDGKLVILTANFNIRNGIFLVLFLRKPIERHVKQTQFKLCRRFWFKNR